MFFIDVKYLLFLVDLFCYSVSFCLYYYVEIVSGEVSSNNIVNNDRQIFMSFFQELGMVLSV